MPGRAADDVWFTGVRVNLMSNQRCIGLQNTISRSQNLVLRAPIGEMRRRFGFRAADPPSRIVAANVEGNSVLTSR